MDEVAPSGSVELKFFLFVAACSNMCVGNYSRSPGYAIYWDMQCRVRASCFFVLRAHYQALHAPIIYILDALQATVITKNTTTMYCIYK